GREVTTAVARFVRAATRAADRRLQRAGSLRERRAGLAIPRRRTRVRVPAARPVVPAPRERTRLGADERDARIDECRLTRRRLGRGSRKAVLDHLCDLVDDVRRRAGETDREIARIRDRGRASGARPARTLARAPAERGERLVVGRTAGTVAAA